MAISLLLAFVNALVATFLVGAVAKLAIGFFPVDRPAGFGAFCVALGFALARFSYGGPPNFHALEAGSAALGAVVALTALWLWLVKRDADAASRTPG